jgi:metal-responsive CopG/Arc/MetJ family transcriptional regulator
MASTPDPDDDAALELVEVDLDQDTAERVDAYRLDHGLETRAKAIIQLIVEGLAEHADTRTNFR